jgi:hypothetical protein
MPAAGATQALSAVPQDVEGSRRKDLKQSNIVDNESAKMPTSHGVVQGYFYVKFVTLVCQFTIL